MSGQPSPRPEYMQSKGSKGEGSARGSKRKALETPLVASTSHGDLTLSPTQSGLSKIAIPRLHQEDAGGLDPKIREAAKVDRTTHACEPCRTRKTKCSGERPICKHCRQFNITCAYADGKRDRVRRHQEQQEHKLALYEALLMEAGPKVGPSIWARFQEAKSFDTNPETDIGQQLREQADWQEQTKDEDARSASEGSMDAIGSISDDPTRSTDAQANDFVCNASEVDRQRNLNQKENPVASQVPQPQWPRVHRPSTISVSSPSYRTGQHAIPEVADPDLRVQDVPPLLIAQHLANTFFRVVYPTFPLLPRFNFEAQLNRAYIGRFEHSARPNDRWRAIMNLVFAVAARFLKLTNDDASVGDASHEVFFARGARLGLVGREFLEQADLQQIQIFGLASLYLLTVNHMNRAWTLAGSALRACVALGLQVEIKSEAMTKYAKEARYRLWWTIYELETMLQIVTGRPAATSFSGFSTPLPVPYDEESFDTSGTTGPSVNMSRFNQTSYRGENTPHHDRIPNFITDAPSAAINPVNGIKAQALAQVEPSNSLYFMYRARLCLIVHEVLRILYQPCSAHFVWSQVQIGIQNSNEMLDDWHSQLPAALDFCILQTNASDCNRNRLAVFFYSVKILANRPCLYGMDPTSPRRCKETKESQGLDEQSANTCIEAAIKIITLLPQDGKPSTWAKNGPWWSMVHHTFSAVTVLTVAMFYACKHASEEQAPVVIEKTKHGLSWLHALAQEPNEGAERAWRIAALTWARICRRLQIDLTGVHVPPEASFTENSEPQQRSDHATSVVLPPFDLVHLSFGGHPGFDPIGYSSLDATMATEINQGFGVDPTIGSLLTSFAGPDGYPIATFAGGLDRKLISPL